MAADTSASRGGATPFDAGCTPHVVNGNARGANSRHEVTTAPVERAANCIADRDVDVRHALGAPRSHAREAREAKLSKTKLWKDWAGYGTQENAD